MNDIDKNQLRSDRGTLVDVLQSAGVVFRGKACRCPFHDDRHASAGVYEKDGVWRFKCHACSINEDVIGVQARLKGRNSADELRDMSHREQAPAKPVRIFPTVEAMVESVRAYSQVEAVYAYANPDTRRVDMVVIRCRDSEGGKSFLQGRPESGGFAMKAPAKPWPLFNRSRVRSASSVVVCEGEKCIKALLAIGIVATTSPGGARNAGNADWSPLNGKDVVSLWPDFDAAGAGYMDVVTSALQKLPQPPRIVRVDPTELRLEPGGDVVDFLERYAGGPVESRRMAVEGVLEDAQPAGPASKVKRLLADTISGKRASVALPWSALTYLTQPLLPGTITALCGEGGSTKTFFVIQCARFWQERGVPWAMQELEEDEDGSTLTRALAQMAVNGDLTDLEWVKSHPAEANDAYAAHEQALDEFGRNLWAVPGSMPGLSDLVDWIRDRVKDHRRVLVIDPITAVDSSGENPWDADKRFVHDAQAILRDGGASLILVTHPKQNRRGPVRMDDMSGGAAYQRHTQTVLWLQRFDTKTVKVKRLIAGHPIEEEAQVNRAVKIFKARNGRGTGMDVGFQFGDGMLFSEAGIIIKKKGQSDPGEPAAATPMGMVNARKLASKLAQLFPLAVNQTQSDTFSRAIQGLERETVSSAIDAYRQTHDVIDWPELFAACKPQAKGSEYF